MYSNSRNGTVYNLLDLEADIVFHQSANNCTPCVKVLLATSCGARYAMCGNKYARLSRVLVTAMVRDPPTYVFGTGNDHSHLLCTMITMYYYVLCTMYYYVLL